MQIDSVSLFWKGVVHGGNLIRRTTRLPERRTDTWRVGRRHDWRRVQTNRRDAATALEPTPLPLEFMNGLSYTTIIEPAEPLARRRGSALDR